MSAWRHEGSSQDEKTGILIHMDIKVCVCLLVYCTIYMQGVIISACVCVFSNMSLGDPAVFNYGSSINVFIFSHWRGENTTLAYSVTLLGVQDGDRH